MSEQKQLINAMRDIGFPMLIAITALLLVLISGIVNYRQNNLADIESSLRDTRDQLQLAKNDIADMKVRTLQQLVEAELTIRNRDKLLDEKDELRDKLSEANARIKELEELIRELDHALESKKNQLATVNNKVAVKSESKSKPASERKMTAVKSTPEADKSPAVEQVKAAASTTDKIAAAEKPYPADVAAEAKPSEAQADLEVFTQNIITPSLQQSIGETLERSGFKAKFPEKRQSMKMTKETTVFYYDKSYRPVAEQLVKNLTDITKGKVILRKGSSPFSKNKIIAHIIVE